MSNHSPGNNQRSNMKKRLAMRPMPAVPARQQELIITDQLAAILRKYVPTVRNLEAVTAFMNQRDAKGKLSPEMGFQVAMRILDDGRARTPVRQERPLEPRKFSGTESEIQQRADEVREANNIQAELRFYEALLAEPRYGTRDTLASLIDDQLLLAADAALDLIAWGSDPFRKELVDGYEVSQLWKKFRHGLALLEVFHSAWHSGRTWDTQKADVDANDQTPKKGDTLRERLKSALEKSALAATVEADALQGHFLPAAVLGTAWTESRRALTRPKELVSVETFAAVAEELIQNRGCNFAPRKIETRLQKIRDEEHEIGRRNNRDVFNSKEDIEYDARSQDSFENELLNSLCSDPIDVLDHDVATGFRKLLGLELRGAIGRLRDLLVEEPALWPNNKVLADRLSELLDRPVSVEYVERMKTILKGKVKNLPEK